MTIDVGARIDIKHTFCRLCEVMCGLEVTVTDGEITKVRPDGDHPVSKGFACNKGLLSLDIHHDPDRLDHPLRRTGDGWEQISWADAVDDVASGLRDVIDRHGPESVAIYLGNPNAFNCLAGPAGALFLLTLGSTRIFSAATQDCANKFTISDILYGSPEPPPDRRPGPHRPPARAGVQPPHLEVVVHLGPRSDRGHEGRRRTGRHGHLRQPAAHRARPR